MINILSIQCTNERTSLFLSLLNFLLARVWAGILLVIVKINRKEPRAWSHTLHWSSALCLAHVCDHSCVHCSSHGFVHGSAHGFAHWFVHGSAHGSAHGFVHGAAHGFVHGSAQDAYGTVFCSDLLSFSFLHH